MKVTICWCFNEYGIPALAISQPGGETLGMSPCPIDGHPGTIHVQVVDLKDGSFLSASLNILIAWSTDPHDCLPSPICDVCGREAGSPEQAMENAVMRGRLGE